MIQTVADLKDRFRRDVSDLEEGPNDNAPDADSLWSNDDIVWYANSAIDRLLRDTCAEIRTFSANVTSGSREVRLPQAFRVLDIKSFKLGSNRVELEKTGVNTRIDDFEDYFHRFGLQIDWQGPETGVPRWYTRDLQSGKVHLHPIPAANDTVIITANITTATTLIYYELGDLLPFDELPDVHLLLMWMKKLAYEKQDADVLDLTRASAFEAEYEGKVHTRMWERYRHRRPTSTVRFSW